MEGHQSHPFEAKEEHASGDRTTMASVDRTKRDEWSEGAVASLLDAYEAKWVLRNRAKLKGQDWEDVAKVVSARAGDGGKSAKTATQCKNKVESMKKRYRSESSTGNGSRWPLYARLDGLVRCREPVTVMTVIEQSGHHEEQQTAPRPVSIAHGTAVSTVPELPKPNGEVAIALLPFQGEVKEQTGKKKHITNETNKDVAAACSAPHSDESSSEEKRQHERSKKRPRGSSGSYMVMKSIQLFAEVALQAEQARIDAMREIETMRAQMEAKRSELDLKRTEIIANTQLKIAKLFTRKYADDGTDSSSDS